MEHLSTPEMVLLGKHQPSGLPPGVLAGPYMLPMRQLPPLPLASQVTQRKEQGKHSTVSEHSKPAVAVSVTFGRLPSSAPPVASVSLFSPLHHPHELFAGALPHVMHDVKEKQGSDADGAQRATTEQRQRQPRGFGRI